MVIERFKDGEAPNVYRRFEEKGRMLPDGLNYINSWVEESLDRCFQLMECEDQKLLEVWTSRWHDLVEFEIVPVINSSDAASRVSPPSDLSDRIDD